MKDARNKLNYYLKRIPTYSTLESQIKILNTELNNYKRNNDTVNYNACKEMLKTLQSKAGEIKQIFSPIEGEKAKAKRLEKLANIKASEKIKELVTKEGLFCGIILTTESILEILRLHINSNEPVEIPFNLYFKES